MAALLQNLTHTTKVSLAVQEILLPRADTIGRDSAAASAAESGLADSTSENIPKKVSSWGTDFSENGMKMPKIDYHAQFNVLVAVRGHVFDRNAFDAIFTDMEGITHTVVDHPAAARLMNPEGMEGFNALLLYDMPGLDFNAEGSCPAYVEPLPELREGFLRLLQSGKGVVAMHHAIAGWPAWPAYADILGGAFLYRPGQLRGQPTADSGYRHDHRYVAQVVAPGHPVTHGLPPSFVVVDETYLYEVFEDEVIPLITADTSFDCRSFYSAFAAMSGRLNDNAGWERPNGSNLIAWARRAECSPLVYIQPGDGISAYTNPHIRRLIQNALLWVASPEARAWAAG